MAVFFGLTGRDGQVLRVAHRDAGDAFVRRLQALPGFGSRALIEAMYSFEDAGFVLWPPGGRGAGGPGDGGR